MLTVPTFDTFHAAYVTVLRHVAAGFEYVNAPRGNHAHECLNVSFRLTNPRDRVAYLASRRANVVFNFAETMWYLWGRDDLDLIGYYARGLRRVSADGRTLTGTAYGPRLFGHADAAGRTQWDRVVELLHADPASKRAVLAIFDPAELASVNNPDVACTIALQFLLRDGRLHAVCYMRANDALRGLAGDVFAFTFLQELLACQFDVELGTYAHHVGSMHINTGDLGRVAAILDEAAEAGDDRPRFDFPAMPPGTSRAQSRIVEIHEASLRAGQPLTAAEIHRLAPGPYWEQVLLLFELYRQITHRPDTVVDQAVVGTLVPALRWLVAHRWPDRIPSAAASEATR